MTLSICNTRETHFCLISAITDVSDATQDGLKALLRETRGARNPNLQVVITHASHVCSQHSFGLPLRMNGMYITQFIMRVWTFYHS